MYCCCCINLIEYLHYVVNLHILLGFDFAPGGGQKLKIENLEPELLAVRPAEDGAECLVPEKSPEEVPEDWAGIFGREALHYHLSVREREAGTAWELRTAGSAAEILLKAEVQNVLLLSLGELSSSLLQLAVVSDEEVPLTVRHKLSPRYPGSVAVAGAGSLQQV